MSGCVEKNKNILLSDSWACPKGASLKSWKDGYSNEEKKYKAIGCRDINNNRVGHHIAWKDYAVKEHEGGFIDDKADGEWSYYHDNGLLKSRGFYRKGTKDGLWSFWDKDGRFLYDKKYNYSIDTMDKEK